MSAILFTVIAFGGFDSYRTNLKELIAAHLLSHADCESRQILDVVDDVEIVESFHINPNLSGWIHEGKIFFNINKKHKWTDRKIALFLIHELIHICGHCLNDSIRSHDRGRPICVFFDRRIYHSMDLTDAIKRHFKL